MNVKYFLGALIAMPLLPLMYFQGKRIKARVPRLPEAKGGEGVCEPPMMTHRSIRIVALGESTIAGVGVDTHEEGFAGTFARELCNVLGVKVSWKVYARSGYTAKIAAEVLVPKMGEEPIDLIVVGLGGNDAFKLHSPRRWRQDIQKLILSLKSRYPDVVIVFCNMPPIKEFPAFTPLIKFVIGNLVEILGRELKTVVRQHQNVNYFGEKITFSGWIDKFKLESNKMAFFSDGVHPSKLTYQIWARDVAGNITKNDQIIKTLQ